MALTRDDLLKQARENLTIVSSENINALQADGAT